MKKIYYVFFTCLLAAGFFCCTKEGPRGPKGSTGAPGVDGNANVKTYIITDSLKLVWHYDVEIKLLFDSTFAIPDSIREEGMILIYMKYTAYSNWWYFTPGLGPGSQFMTRAYYGDNTLNITRTNPDGSSWSGGAGFQVLKIRIVLVSPSELELIGRKSAMPDFSNYDATMEYFGINE